MEDNKQQIATPKVILLDVYETMLDMSEMERRVNTMLDSKRGYIIWFELLMQYCFVDNCTEQFNDFAAIAKATMKMAGKMLGRTVTDNETNEILELHKHLPVKEGIPQGLSLLADRGYRIAALTNANEQPLKERMERTGLISYFEKILCAERVKKYKPCIEVYQWAAKELDANMQEVLLVSSHPWDIVGGANAGMQTAYVKQNRQMLYPLAPSPNYTCNNLEDLAGQLDKMPELAAVGNS